MDRYLIYILHILISTVFSWNQVMGQHIQIEQPVSIITNTSSEASNLILDIQSDDQGILIPRMDAAQIASIQHPVEGLFVIGSDDGCLHVFNQGKWKRTCNYKYVNNSTTPPKDSAVWTSISTGPPPRRASMGFSVDNQGYILGGAIDVSMRRNDVWKYNPTTDQWTELGGTPGEDRAWGVAFIIGNQAYYGLGWGATTFGLKDMWRYDAASDSWEQLPDFPGEGRHSPSYTVWKGKAYLGLGNGPSGSLADWWVFDPMDGSWTQLNSFPGDARSSAIALASDGKIYVGLGRIGATPQVDFWEYDIASDTWTQKNDAGCGPRFSALVAQFDNRNVVGLGFDGVDEVKDFWEYFPSTDEWHQIHSLPGAERTNASSFTIGSTLYLGTGNNSGTEYNDFYKFEIPRNYIQYSDSNSEITWIPKDTIQNFNDGYHRALVSAKLTAKFTVTPDRIVTFEETHDPNNLFSNNTTFTVPKDGKYFFSTHISFADGIDVSSPMIIGFHVNNQISSLRTSCDPRKFTRPGIEQSTSLEGILSLQAGDEVTVKFSNVNWTTFDVSAYTRIFNGMFMSE